VLRVHVRAARRKCETLTTGCGFSQPSKFVWKPQLAWGPVISAELD
jgi:hypothetical protein